MSFQIPSSVKTLNPVLLHEWAGPFYGANFIAAQAAANAYIPGGVRVQGLEVILIAFGYALKYWYQHGTTDADLIPMGTDPLEIQDEGLTVDLNTRAINFTGAGVTATSVTSGLVEVNIPGGGGTSSCGDILKIAAVSGKFASASLMPPSLSNMLVGNTDYGWSDGKYNAPAKCDGYGNMQSIEANYINCFIPLPADFLSGDIIKICGVAISSAGITPDEFPNDYNFYLSVSQVNCNNLNSPNFYGEINLSTLISPQVFPFTLKDGPTLTTRVCFSASTTVTSQLPGCTTYLVVGLNAGSTTSVGTYDGEIKFSYTLDGVKHCSTGTNLFIRNCCEPLYSEIIANNSTPVGESFSDADGNCWTVVAETHNNITGTRTKANAYNDCTACTAANPCPLNYLVESCCTPGTQTFSASISSSLAIGDGFVDNNGFCWIVVDTTSTPSTYIISVVTVYPVGGDPCTECITSNPCPQFIILDSCCGLGPGYTTEALLTAGGYTPASYPTTIIDQFGFCWYAHFVERDKPPAGGYYPNLGFIEAVSESVDCNQCINDNICPPSLFYTLRNCCTEEIFVAELSASYYMEMQLTIIAAESVGCFTVQGWSTTGPATLTSVIVIGTSFPGIGDEAIKACVACYAKSESFGCYGEVGCFRTIRNFADATSNVTYIGCDGVYHYNETFTPGALVCVMWWDETYTGQPADWADVGEVCLQVFNPSSTETITVGSSNSGSCGGPDLYTVLAPGDATPCGSCFNLVDWDFTSVRWEVVTPNTC